MNSREIIKKVLREQHLAAEDFLGRNRDGHLVSARKEAARRLSEAGYSASFIARAINRGHTTVLFYLNADMRERKSDRARQRYLKTKLFKLINPMAQDVLLQTASCEETSPEVIIAQWVNERAQYEASAKARAA